MKSTRRKGLFYNLAEPIRRQRAPKQFVLARLVEELESRMLLTTTMATASITWNGVVQTAVPGQYVFSNAFGGNLQAQIASAGLQVDGLKSLGDNYYELYDSKDSVATVNAWANSHPGIAFQMFPNHPITIDATPTEMAGAAINNFWYFNNTGQTVTATAGDVSLGIPAVQAGIPGADINALNAWNLETGSATTIVAVLDTGINYNDPDLINRVWDNTRDPWTNPAAPPGDGVDNDLDGVVDDYHGANFSDTGAADDPLDDNGHGTLVSGLIAAQANNAAAFVGVNWTAQILPVKVLDAAGEGSDASILAGLNYVITLKTLRGVNISVMNMSLGRAIVGPANGVGDPGAAAIFDALDRVGQAGIITTVAAGNDGVSLADFPDLPASSNNDLVVTVAATDNRDNPTIFTNFGDQAKIAAPGQSIVGLGPDDGGSGTSFAAPLVAGALALLHSLEPNASPQQLVNALLEGVDVKPQLQGYVTTSGRLNVANSLEILMGQQQAYGHIDSITSTQVSGWLFDPNVGAGAIYGQILVDGKFAASFLANQNRPDLLNVVGSTNHGFTVTLPVLTAGPHKIQVVAMDVFPDAQGNIRHVTNAAAVTNPHALNDTNSAYNMTPVFITAGLPTGGTVGGSTGGGTGVTVNGNSPPVGFVDSVDPTHVVGWAFDAQAGSLPVNVLVYIDGQLRASGSADLNRPDLARLNFGSINHGFDILLPTNLSVGPHRVSVYALDSTTGQPTLIGSKTLQENAPIAYFVDNNPGSSIFTGYVYDPDHPNATIDLELEVDGKQVAYFPNTANQSRLDVPISNQNHGFSITLAPQLPGGHFVQLTAYDPASGLKTVIAARNIAGEHTSLGSFAVNSQKITGFTYDQDATGASVNYRMDIDGQTGSVFNSTEGAGSLSGPVVDTPATPVLPNITNNITLDITQFGAVSTGLNAGSDGQAPENTFAIQTAINNVSAAGGGTVYIGSGDWETESLTLRSNVDLFLDSGAILEMVRPQNAAGTLPNGTFYTGGRQAMLHGTNVVNFEITGTGTIDGEGASWAAPAFKPGLLELDGSSDILISGVEFANFAGTAITFGTATVNGQLRGTDDVTIDNIVLDFRNLSTALVGTPITTSVGINLAGSDYLIENCQTDIASGNTEYGLNSGLSTIIVNPANIACSNINITNDYISRGQGITVGPNTTHGVDTLVIDSDLFNGSTFGVRMISTNGIGGVVQNVRASNIMLGGGVGTPIDIVATAAGGTLLSNLTPLFQNIVFDGWHNISATVTAATTITAGTAGRVLTFTGLTQQPIAGVSLYNFDFNSTLGLFTTNVIGIYIDASVAPVVASPIFQTISGKYVEMPSDAHYYSFATPNLAPGTHTLSLYAIDPINGDNILIRTMTYQVPALSAANTQPVGTLVSATGGATSINITGYTIDPNTAAPIQVQVQVDGVVKGTFTANAFQANLPIQYGPNHGYNITLPNLVPGSHEVNIYAIDAADPTQHVLIGSSQVLVGGLRPAAQIELTRGDYLVVKAFGYANFIPANAIYRITVDGNTGQTIPAGTLGPVTGGVSTLYFKIPPIDPTKAHNISVEYIDPLTLIPITLATTVLQASPGVIGALTVANTNVLAGYVYSPEIPERSLNIFLASDAGPVQQYVANLPTANLGNHGFSITTLGVPAGTHRVTIFAIDPVDGIYIAIGTAVITIPQP